jgi:hypothetical protein
VRESGYAGEDLLAGHAVIYYMGYYHQGLHMHSTVVHMYMVVLTYCLSNPFLQFIDDVERRVPNPEPSACQSPAILHRKDQFCRRGNAPSSLGPCGASWWDGTGGLGCGFPGAGSTSSTTLCCRCACEVRAVSLGYWHWTVILEFHRSIDRSLVRSRRSCVVPAVSQCICG